MFKAGDIVKFTPGTYHAQNWPGEFIVTRTRRNLAYLKRPKETHDVGGYYFTRLELVQEATPIDKQAAIIAKIKYLNTRFYQRKQHAALG